MPHAIDIPITTDKYKGKTYKVANFTIIDLAALEAGDQKAADELLSAAQGPGMFFLDLRNSETGKQLLADAPEGYIAQKEYFAQPKDVKMKDFREGQDKSKDRGYKFNPVVDMFEMAYNELIESNLPLPAGPLRNHEPALRRFTDYSQRVCRTMLSRLGTSLGVSPSDLFERHHRPNQQSETGLKLLSGPSMARLADVRDNTHTDSGTLTLLLYDVISLEARLPDRSDGAWAFAPDIRGCALVNIGNALERLSSGKLHSPTHRVNQITDGVEERLYLSYFMRPEEELLDQWARAEATS